MKPERTAIVGAGAWGTALAVMWSDDHRDVLLWGHRPEIIAHAAKSRENSKYLPGVVLPETLRLTSKLEDCAGADLIVFVTPSTAFREIGAQLRRLNVRPESMLLSCTKGIEPGTGSRMTGILRELFPQNPTGALSGPNLALEVCRGVPTAAVIGCSNDEAGLVLQAYLGRPRFRIYTGADLTGIELGGALKNIFAIAAGASDGLGLGDNTKAALVTRALAEMVRLGTAMGGNPDTFYGLSGAGDLIATCFSKLSRNRRVGEELARGVSLDQVVEKMQTMAEGIPTTRSAMECARRLQIETPIIDQIYAVLFERRAPAQAMEELLGRDPKPEKL